MNSPEPVAPWSARERLLADGYIVLERLLPEATVRDLNARIERILAAERERPFDPGDGKVLPEDAAFDDQFGPFRTNEAEHARLMRRIRHSRAEDFDTPWPVSPDDPDQLRAIKPPTDEHFDSRLNHLWRLLHAIGENRNHFAINDLTPLKPMLGPAVVDAVRRAFVACWRHISPELRSERPAEDRSKIRNLDCIGITGVTLEAAGDVGWAAELSYGDAVRAAIFATLELGGFPSLRSGVSGYWKSLAIGLARTLSMRLGPQPMSAASRPIS